MSTTGTISYALLSVPSVKGNKGSRELKALERGFIQYFDKRKK
jgi:hypothetical protein